MRTEAISFIQVSLLKLDFFKTFLTGLDWGILQVAAAYWAQVHTSEAAMRAQPAPEGMLAALQAEADAICRSLGISGGGEEASGGGGPAVDAAHASGAAAVNGEFGNLPAAAASMAAEWSVGVAGGPMSAVGLDCSMAGIAAAVIISSSPRCALWPSRNRQPIPIPHCPG